MGYSNKKYYELAQKPTKNRHINNGGSIVINVNFMYLKCHYRSRKISLISLNVEIKQGSKDYRNTLINIT